MLEMSQESAGQLSQSVFVMMPFESGFDDVYEAIKDSIASVDDSIKVMRIDEIRAAGYITEDLVEELRKSTLCVADVTGANPNVMWEVGFATALRKPLIAIRQETGGLPFDIKDIRALPYDRTYLSKTLRDPLVKALKETLERYIANQSSLAVGQLKLDQLARDDGVAARGSETDNAAIGLWYARYRDHEEVYSALAQQVVLTRRRIMTTYFRRKPPDHYASHSAPEYFAAILAWANEPGARSVRRIICAPNAEMRGWASRHYEECREIKNYEVQVIPWSVDADGINIALFDDSVIFLVFSGEATFQDIVGIRLESKQLLSCFESYFNQLWHSRNGKTLGEFVSGEHV
jgi:hypothetical protein